MSKRWPVVTKSSPCKICGSDHFCKVAPDGRACLCAKVQSPKWVGKNGVGGYWHWLDKLPGGVVVPKPSAPVERRPPEELESIVRRARLAHDARRLVSLANKLGLSARTLSRFRVGWVDGLPMTTARGTVMRVRAWTFPMTSYRLLDGRLKSWTCGIRFRREDGEKFSYSGGTEGLFVPEGLPRGGPIATAEGPTSSGACLDLGVPCVGRSNCCGGGDDLYAVLSRVPSRDLGIVGDRDPKVWCVYRRAHGRKVAGQVGECPEGDFDRLAAEGVVERYAGNGPDRWPGKDGAVALAERLAPVCRSVTVAIPPAKDVRQWKNDGATRADLVRLLGKPFEQYL